MDFLTSNFIFRLWCTLGIVKYLAENYKTDPLIKHARKFICLHLYLFLLLFFSLLLSGLLTLSQTTLYFIINTFCIVNSSHVHLNTHTHTQSFVSPWLLSLTDTTFCMSPQNISEDFFTPALSPLPDTLSQFNPLQCKFHSLQATHHYSFQGHQTPPVALSF